MSAVTSVEFDGVQEKSETIKDRQTWMGLLARADKQTLETVWADLNNKPEFSLLRAPETGMVMVRARAGGEGARFNMGEMSVTRCVVRTEDGRMGHSYVAGRDRRHAELAAVFDALMQDPDRRESLEADLLNPTRDALNAKYEQRAAKAAATKVDFFTMVRGDD